MPRVTIKTGFLEPDGKEEELTEFLCDISGCPNIATELAGCVKELGVALAICEEHARALKTSRATIDRES